MSPNSARSSGIEADREPVRDEGPVGRGEPLGLHRALDPPLQLDGLQAGSKQASGWSLEEAFEEPLDGGQHWHGRSRSLPEGRQASARPLPTTPDHPHPPPSTPVTGALESLGYTLAPVRRIRPFGLSSAHPGGPMAEVLTESFCERCGTRYTFELAKPRVKRLDGRQGPVAWAEELRPVRRLVAGRGDGRRPERYGARGHLAAAGRLPQDLQLLHDVPPVHVRELLERGGGHLPHLLAAPGPRDPAGSVPGSGSARHDRGARRGRRRAPRMAPSPTVRTGPTATVTTVPAIDAGAWPTMDAWPTHDLASGSERDAGRPVCRRRDGPRRDRCRSPDGRPHRDRIRIAGHRGGRGGRGARSRGTGRGSSLNPPKPSKLKLPSNPRPRSPRSRRSKPSPRSRRSKPSPSRRPRPSPEVEAVAAEPEIEAVAARARDRSESTPAVCTTRSRQTTHDGRGRCCCRRPDHGPPRALPTGPEPRRGDRGVRARAGCRTAPDTGRSAGRRRRTASCDTT